MRIEAAERRETSCSPLRPPKRTPTRSFFTILVLILAGGAMSIVHRWVARQVHCAFVKMQTTSQNLLSESGACEFHSQISGTIAFVDDGIDFDDFEAEQTAMVGENFHRQVGFSIGSAATHRSAYSWSVFRVDPVHIERDVVASSAVPSGLQGLFHHCPHTALVDVAHGIDLGHAGAPDVFALGGVDVAHTEDDGVLRGDFWRVAEDLAERPQPRVWSRTSTQTEQRGQRHAVDIA